jgi:tetratricopeptide (TPR) repeat protein
MRGDLDGAMKLYQQSLEITEGLGDLQGKSATLHGMADVFMMRSDLDEAKKLYQQSLEITVGLGDLQGQSEALNSIGVVFFQRNRYADALKLLLPALSMRIQLQTIPDIENSVSFLKQFQQTIGKKAFHKLWRKVTGSKQLPDWLEPKEKHGILDRLFKR